MKTLAAVLVVLFLAMVLGLVCLLQLIVDIPLEKR